MTTKLETTFTLALPTLRPIKYNSIHPIEWNSFYLFKHCSMYLSNIFNCIIQHFQYYLPNIFSDDSNLPKLLSQKHYRAITHQTWKLREAWKVFPFSIDVLKRKLKLSMKNTFWVWYMLSINQLWLFFLEMHNITLNWVIVFIVSPKELISKLKTSYPSTF